MTKIHFRSRHRTGNIFVILGMVRQEMQRQHRIAEYGTAVGLFKSIVSFILVMSANKITAKLNDSALF